MKLIAAVIITLAAKLVKMKTPYRLSQRGRRKTGSRSTAPKSDLSSYPGSAIKIRQPLQRLRKKLLFL
jgi:hypothetical protein